MADLPRHSVHADTKIDQFDVFIAGSGPIGGTYARLLVQRGFNVCMVELGDIHDGLHPGAHLKNEIRFQKDIDKFVRVIQGAMQNVSIPTSSMVIQEMDPAAWQPPITGENYISHGRNPNQNIANNLGAEAVTHAVGGMSTHWTCATPQFLKGVERPVIFPNDGTLDDREWDKLYNAARILIGTSETEFDKSIRHNTVLNALKADPRFANRGVKALPLACHRINDSPYVRWHSAENVYGPNLFPKPPSGGGAPVPAPGHGVFALLSNTRCTKLHTDPNGEVAFAEVRDLLKAMQTTENIDMGISAKVFVIASGAVATPQILAKSGFGGLRSQQDAPPIGVRIPNLGKRITEQPLAFCQIVLRRSLVDAVESKDHPEWWVKAVEAHKAQYPNDPIPIPVQDPEPQVTIPASVDFPWHTQIHRDAFSYGEAGPRIDPRLVVDVRFFGMQDGVPQNRMILEDTLEDLYGMPQPTFEYTPTEVYAQQATDVELS
jgi:pyranose oxidase